MSPIATSILIFGSVQSQIFLKKLPLVESERQTAKINHQRAKIILSKAKKFFDHRKIHQVTTTHTTGFLIDRLHEFEAQADLIIIR